MIERGFRGQKVDTKEWVYGYLFGIWEKRYILWGTTNGIPNMTEVIPNTIGQSTGLYDKNVKEIYDGDIFAHPNAPKYKYAVEWEGGGFTVFTDDAGFTPLSIEIIGNKYENPELLI